MAVCRDVLFVILLGNFWYFYYILLCLMDASLKDAIFLSLWNFAAILSSYYNKFFEIKFIGSFFFPNSMLRTTIYTHWITCTWVLPKCGMECQEKMPSSWRLPWRSICQIYLKSNPICFTILWVFLHKKWAFYVMYICIYLQNHIFTYIAPLNQNFHIHNTQKCSFLFIKRNPFLTCVVIWFGGVNWLC